MRQATPPDDIECSREDDKLFKGEGKGHDKDSIECIIKADEDKKKEVMDECCTDKAQGKVNGDGSKASFNTRSGKSLTLFPVHNEKRRRHHEEVHRLCG
jgi:hypothetical protein